eukprot:gene15947-17550_t
MELESGERRYKNNEEEKDVFIQVDPGNVRRKLFQEEAMDSNELYSSLNENNEPLPSRHVNKERLNINKKQIKTNEQSHQVDILVISQCKDGNIFHQLKARTRFVCDNTINFFHSYPDCALNLCCSKSYDLIFLDLNGNNLEYMIKLSSAIRVSTVNQETPIVALRQIGSLKEDYWRKFGISDIVYGALYSGVVDKIINKWLAWKFKLDQNGCDTGNNATSAMIKDGEEKGKSFQKHAMHSGDLGLTRQGWSNTSCSPSPVCDSTDQIASYTSSGSPNSNLTVQIHYTTTNYNEQNAIQANPSFVSGGSSNSIASSSSCSYLSASNPVTTKTVDTQVEGTARPTYPTQSDINPYNSSNFANSNNSSKANSSWNMIQQILDLHQSGQKASDYKAKHTAIVATSDAPSTTLPKQIAACQSTAAMCQPGIKSYNVPHSILPAPIIPPNTSYMINGTPGTSNMKIALIPDEYAKHSSKERERRERIKDSTNELRKLLPKQLVNGKKQDMATVLELTVHYLQAVHNHIPTVIQQQLFQSLLVCRETIGKRKRRNIDSSPNAATFNRKHQRLQSSSLMHGCHVGPYPGPAYLPQMLQGNSQQPSSYFPSFCHPIISSSYFGSLTPGPSLSPYRPGMNNQMSAHLPTQAEHDIHPKSQFYNEASTSQSSVPHYYSVPLTSRNPTSNGTQKDVGHQNFKQTF